MPDLKVLLGVDIDPSVVQIKSDLTKIKPHLDGKLKIALSLDTSLIDKQLKDISKLVIETTANATKTRPKIEINGDIKFIKNLQNDINKLTQDDKLITYLNKIEQTLRGFGSNTSNDLKATFTEVKSSIESFQSLFTGKTGFNLSGFSLEEIKQVEQSLKDFTTAQSKLNSQLEVARIARVQDTSFDKARNDIKQMILMLESYKSANTNIQKNPVFANKLDSLIEQAKGFDELAEKAVKAGKPIDGLDKKFIDLTSRVRTFKIEAQSEGLIGQTFLTRLSEQAQKLGIYLSGAFITMGAVRQIKQMIGSVIELDGVVTDLQVATGYTREATKELLDTYSELGKELGATTIDVGKSADGWLRQGHSVQETNKLIKDSLMLSKLGQIESADATRALTSSQKGYKMSVEETTSIVDKLTAVDMKAAVSAGYVATAMAETATGARLAGVDINRLIGYITTVGEITQDGAESVGNFFKTTFARMGNIKQGKLIDPETQEDLSNVEKVLNSLDIKLRENGKEFRDYGDVLDDVAAKWDTYSEVNKKAIAVAFGMTLQQEKFLTLMDNYGDAMGYAEVATNSAGTALDKYENTYLKSVAASQEKFNATMEQLSSTLVNSDLIKGTFDTGSGVLGFLNSIISFLGTIPSLATIAAGALSAISNKGWLIESDKICPLQSGGDTERVKYRDGVFNKRLYSKCLKWCA